MFAEVAAVVLTNGALLVVRFQSPEKAQTVKIVNWDGSVTVP